MKQCPVCKTAYSDDTLVFCLSDGASLAPMSEPPTTKQIPFDRMRTEIAPVADYSSAPTIISAPSSVPKNNKSLIYGLLGIVSILLLAIIGFAGYIIYKNSDSDRQSLASNSSSPTPASSTAEENTQRLKERLANVERQLSEQKNAPPKQAATPFSASPQPSSPQEESKTATVIPTTDGFLALRSLPNTKNGVQILKIPSGATVEVKSCQKNVVTIGGRRGRWCMISYDGKAGWVYEAFLNY